jgi:hypothetical protein
LFLVNDAGDAGQNLGYMPFPSTATLSNGQCTITGTGSTVSETGSTLTLTLNVTFKAAFGGNRIVYAAVRDAGRNSGWKAKGSYAVPPAKPMDPMVVSMTPARGTANTGVYTFRFQDPTGTGNLGVLNVLVNDFLDGRVACYLAYSIPAQRLYLVEDLGDASKLVGAGILGAAGKIGNSQCSVNLAASSTAVSGTNLDLRLDLTFTDVLAGDRIFYVAARSANETRNSGWQPKGTVGSTATGLSTRLLSLAPASASKGQNLNATVTAQGTAFVAGQVTASLGGGVTVGPVTVNSPTSLTLGLAVASGAALGNRNLTVTHGGLQYQLGNALSITEAGGGGLGPPTITDFSPQSAPAGSLVTVTGTNLQPGPAISLAKQGGGTISAPAGTASATTLTFTIPPGAMTGPVSVTVTGRTASSATPLTINSSKTFTISALPGTAQLVRGQAVSFAVKLTSGDGFSSLAALSAGAVPAGVIASFKPLQITAGQTSILTLTAPATQALGSTAISIGAAAIVEGLSLSHTVPATINVIAPTTSFIGRTVVDDPLETSIGNVTVTMLGKNGSGGTTGCTGTTVSDAAGNFALRNLPPSCVGMQLIGYDGLTATSPPGKFAGVNLVYTLVAGQVKASPVLVHLPRIDDKETFLVQQNSSVDQSYSFNSVPGLSVTVYKNTIFTMPNGSQPNPFPLVGVQVPIDRLPDAKPPVPTMLLVFIVAFQPANAKASQPVAVYYPNTIQSPPGTNMPMLTLDPTRGAMIPYGTGTVSSDGGQIVPDLDPGFPGKRYGIVNFDWHGPMPPPPSRDPPPDACPITPPPAGPSCSVCLAGVYKIRVALGGRASASPGYGLSAGCSNIGT